MYRLKPTTIMITASEVTEAERHSRYRKHLADRKRIGTGCRAVTALENEETSLEHAMNTRIQTPDTDSTSRQRTRSSPSSDALSREEEPTPAASLARNGIDGEAGAVRLSVRSRLVNMINDAIEQDDDDGRTVQQLLATALGVSTRRSERESTHDRHEDSLETINRPIDVETMASMIAEELNVTPPRRNLSVYSDALPVNGQPQTPSQLPEARHQSRFNGAYTAPVRGRRIEVDIGDTPVTVRRRRAGRNTSLVGLSPELHSLYEDSQNADDA
ncbi:hypothetical protein FLAG1_05104 [Fusarium langsethiae]|uniref:Uncharacterized protein n=1 Tax=Fusarium langsethiae TaxID=179993 RepID=A0A0M9EYB3_FUSLA|nr:hypothetical protein FLAG1_05104 [Fusarium langsethiae]GKU02903.1 unnamed protein product [Fusarium langsethiae]GKU18257.1 unnamed protein product [Fusarium langsethiae]